MAKIFYLTEVFRKFCENTGYENNGMMILPPMAMIVVGLIIWVQRSRNKSLIEHK